MARRGGASAISRVFPTLWAVLTTLTAGSLAKVLAYARTLPAKVMGAGVQARRAMPKRPRFQRPVFPRVFTNRAMRPVYNRAMVLGLICIMFVASEASFGLNLEQARYVRRERPTAKTTEPTPTAATAASLDKETTLEEQQETSPESSTRHPLQEDLALSKGGLINYSGTVTCRDFICEECDSEGICEVMTCAKDICRGRVVKFIRTPQARLGTFPCHVDGTDCMAAAGVVSATMHRALPLQIKQTADVVIPTPGPVATAVALMRWESVTYAILIISLLAILKPGGGDGNPVLIIAITIVALFYTPSHAIPCQTLTTFDVTDLVSGQQWKLSGETGDCVSGHIVSGTSKAAFTFHFDGTDLTSALRLTEYSPTRWRIIENSTYACPAIGSSVTCAGAVSGDICHEAKEQLYWKDGCGFNGAIGSVCSCLTFQQEQPEAVATWHVDPDRVRGVVTMTFNDQVTTVRASTRSYAHNALFGFFKVSCTHSRPRGGFENLVVYPYGHAHVPSYSVCGASSAPGAKLGLITMTAPGGGKTIPGEFIEWHTCNSRGCAFVALADARQLVGDSFSSADCFKGNVTGVDMGGTVVPMPGNIDMDIMWQCTISVPEGTSAAALMTPKGAECPTTYEVAVEKDAIFFKPGTSLSGGCYVRVTNTQCWFSHIYLVTTALTPIRFLCRNSTVLTLQPANSQTVVLPATPYAEFIAHTFRQYRTDMYNRTLSIIGDWHMPWTKIAATVREGFNNAGSMLGVAFPKPVIVAALAAAGMVVARGPGAVVGGLFGLAVVATAWGSFQEPRAHADCRYYDLRLNPTIDVDITAGGFLAFYQEPNTLFSSTLTFGGNPVVCNGVFHVLMHKSDFLGVWCYGAFGTVTSTALTVTKGKWNFVKAGVYTAIGSSAATYGWCDLRAAGSGPYSYVSGCGHFLPKSEAMPYSGIYDEGRMACFNVLYPNDILFGKGATCNGTTSLDAAVTNTGCYKYAFGWGCSCSWWDVAYLDCNSRAIVEPPTPTLRGQTCTVHTSGVHGNTLTCGNATYGPHYGDEEYHDCTAVVDEYATHAVYSTQTGEKLIKLAGPCRLGDCGLPYLDKNGRVCGLTGHEITINGTTYGVLKRALRDITKYSRICGNDEKKKPTYTEFDYYYNKVGEVFNSAKAASKGVRETIQRVVPQDVRGSAGCVLDFEEKTVECGSRGIVVWNSLQRVFNSRRYVMAHETNAEWVNGFTRKGEDTCVLCYDSMTCAFLIRAFSASSSLRLKTEVNKMTYYPWVQPNTDWQWDVIEAHYTDNPVGSATLYTSGDYADKNPKCKYVLGVTIASFTHSLVSTGVLVEPHFISNEAVGILCQDSYTAVAARAGRGLFVDSYFWFEFSKSGTVSAIITIEYAAYRECLWPQAYTLDGKGIEESNLFIPKEIGGPVSSYNHEPGYTVQLNGPWCMAPLDVKPGSCPKTTVTVSNTCGTGAGKSATRSTRKDGSTIEQWCCRSCKRPVHYEIKKDGSCYYPPQIRPVTTEQEAVESSCRVFH